MDYPTATTLPTPPYHHSPTNLAAEDDATTTTTPPPLSRKKPMSPSPLHLSNYSLHELLLLSPPPSSTHRRSKSRVAAAVDESIEMAGGGATPRRKRRGSRGAAEQRAAAAAASPRNVRRARRRLEKEIGREEREREGEEDAAGKARRRKQTRTVAKAAAVAAGERVVVVQKEDLSLALVPSPINPTRRNDNAEQSGWEGLWERIVELVMWTNIAKSALWFGFGSMFFSSSFSRDINFSPISAICHLGVMILGLSFFKDSVAQRQQVEWQRSFQLTEDDFLRAARVVLPVANSAVSTAQVIFSGDPSMTLKVLPVLLFGAKYGSLITVWRLLATGFFTSFTLPKLYTCYSSQIHRTVEGATDRVWEAWKSCPRKKLVAATAVTMCWNLVSVKTRIMAAFISVVLLRYYHQYRRVEENSQREIDQEEEPQALVIED